MSLRHDELLSIGEQVCEAAMELFEKCGSKDDFCIQDASGPNIVFGGLNRVLFHPVHGFWLDRSYCSPQFIKKFDILIEGNSV